MELKTLKDMNFMKQFKVKDELKQEAIKWVKFYDRMLREGADDYYKGRRDMIATFADITEEDLK